MFTVGEFSKLAQVSKRLLRYYDEIGLLKPVRTDPLTGYRYYSADQLAELNRILVLKELGLSLDQTQRVLGDHISADEMQGMLLLKKAEIEQQLRRELQRVRSIESRLQSIRSAESNQPVDVVVKSVPAQAAMSARTVVESFEVALMMLRQIRRALPVKSGAGLGFVICHDDDRGEQAMDLEMGLFVESKSPAPVAVTDGLQLRFREMPAVTAMAATVVHGPLETIHMGYADIGRWVGTNGYVLAGIPREIILQPPRAADGHDLISEIQYPVEPVSPR